MTELYSTPNNQPYSPMGPGPVLYDPQAFSPLGNSYGAPAPATATAPATTAGNGGGWMGNFWSQTNSQGMQSPGWGQQGMNMGMGALQAYLAIRQYGLARDAFNENRRQFNLNYDNQAQQINRELEERQRTRVHDNPSFYESVGSYMDRNRVPGR